MNSIKGAIESCKTEGRILIHSATYDTQRIRVDKTIKLIGIQNDVSICRRLDHQDDEFGSRVLDITGTKMYRLARALMVIRH